MSYTLPDIRSWRTDVLTDAAENVEGEVETFRKLLRESERSLERLGDSWHGKAARAADSRVRTEIAFGRRISAAVVTFEGAVRDGAHRLWSVRHTLLSKVDAARGDSFLVLDDFRVEDTQTFDSSDPSSKDKVAARQKLLDHHVDVIGDALSTLATEDKKVGFAVDNALDELRATTADVASGNEYLPPRSPSGMSRSEVAELMATPAFREWMAHHPDAAKTWLDQAVDDHLLPATDKTYRDFVQAYWEQQAFDAAGIDPSTWDTTKGANANSDTISKVYEYYGQLFLDHPELQWAGMANMIGPSFAGGFYDLDMLRKIAQGVKNGTQRIPDVPGGVDDDFKRMIDTVAGMSDDEVNFYESTLLGMQKEIFTDQASLHEAYLLGGTDETDRLTAAGVMDRSTGDAWHDIASGDPATVERGNAQLLHREQWDIIADDYDTMRDHPGTGGAMTWMITAVGQPSIPGAKGYADVFPETIDLHTPDHIGPVRVPSFDGGELETPLPDGNIADVSDRWNLIAQDTLPAYQDLLREHPDQARELIGSDFDSRVGDARMVHHVDDVVEHFLTDWHYRR